MGIFSTQHHYHEHKSITNFPNRIDVHEHKAPTDESLKLMEEFHDKALKNLVSKVKVENNIMKGKCFCFQEPFEIDSFKLVFKFAINEKEFSVEKRVSSGDLIGDRGLSNIDQTLNNYANSVMLWYAIKILPSLLYEHITGNKVPEYLTR